MKRKIFIGTSGWAYKDWAEKFYPPKFKNKLDYYAKYFNTVEVNATFYRLPQRKVFKQWKKITGPDFIFSIKISRYISHRKRLKTDEEGKVAIKNFIHNSKGLGDKLGLILVQLPASAKANSSRLEKFLKFISKIKIPKSKIAMEFRNTSWLDARIYKILKKYKAGFVITLSPEIPTDLIFTSDFSYIRFHGPGKLFASRYPKKRLDFWTDKIDKFPATVKKTYCYFNNDFGGYAIDNAKYLKKIFDK